MKMFGSLFLVLVACSFCGFAQEAQAPHTLPLISTDVPVVDRDAKISFLEAQHKLDLIDKQIKDLGLQFQAAQAQAQTRFSQMTEEQKAGQAALDNIAAKLCGDSTKWKLNYDTVTCTADQHHLIS